MLASLHLHTSAVGVMNDLEARRKCSRSAGFPNAYTSDLNSQWQELTQFNVECTYYMVMWFLKENTLKCGADAMLYSRMTRAVSWRLAGVGMETTPSQILQLHAGMQST